ARLEHERWASERRREGWRHGPVRDDTAKVNPSLVAWDDLADDVKQFNRDAVTEWVPMLARAGFEIVRLAPAPSVAGSGAWLSGQLLALADQRGPPAAPGRLDRLVQDGESFGAATGQAGRDLAAVGEGEHQSLGVSLLAAQELLFRDEGEG